MSARAKGEPKASDGRHRSGRIQVAVRGVPGSRGLAVRGDCTTGQLKLALSERLGAPAGQLELVHAGRVLRESEHILHVKGRSGPVKLCLVRRSKLVSAQPPGYSSLVRTESEAARAPDHTLTVPTASALCLVEGLEGLDLDSSGPQMESQILPAPLSSRPLTPPGSGVQQVLNTSPDVGPVPSNTGVRNQAMGFTSDPEMIREDPETTPGASAICQKTEAKTQQTSPKLQSPEAESSSTLRSSEDSADPLKDLTAAPKADPGSQSSIPTGKILQPHHANTADVQRRIPVVSSESFSCSLWPAPRCLRYAGPAGGDHSESGSGGESAVWAVRQQPPELPQQQPRPGRSGDWMLLSHPLFSQNPQLQQQMRQQIPLFLEQMQTPELLSAMLNPKAMEALHQIQQGLQTLAEEAPSILPTAGLEPNGDDANEAPELASDCCLNSQSGNGLQVATATEQQQKFVHQMLQALANTTSGARQEEQEFQQELEQLSSIGFRDRRANLQALISSGGDLSTAIQHLLAL
ncbi:unnamed protein product [Menidia menidia]|uniref:(Atlantic silverside) hypothetical protein n=1 Tax=Menidia menidia TaxID=238744 RepID=A0A8S4B173_9TELE|nr:unnamed protein product [Menidia menidia]